VAIRPPKSNSQGFTLIEMIVTVMVAGILMGLAAPSFLSLNKPLRDGSLQFKSHLGLVRSKAISSNKAYRIRPKYPQKADYKGQNYQETPHNFVVEYATNCQVNTYGYGLASSSASATTERPYNATYPSGSPDGWMAASQLDLDLPEQIGVVDSPLPKIDGTDVSATSKTIKYANKSADTSVAFASYLSWEICYDNRGVAYKSASLTLKDFQGNNKAIYAFVDVSKVGDIEIKTKDKNETLIPRINGSNTDDTAGSPSF
jgi:prepilin-type N-terminal cleavage/methylation domain-containing protein